MADIAARAGVTERTFFRYFTDKREVLFDSSHVLEHAVVDAITAAPPDAAPINVVVDAFVEASRLLEERREFARQRAAVIGATTSLHERELLKLAQLDAAAAEALRRRGEPGSTATLAAQTGMTVFRIGFDRWLAAPPARSLAACINDALDELRALTATA
ncbi:MAG TPA: TetR family transcriptional regulator [Mycobacteriales bacterium]|nr:TetR family transcriptional regulator [Mycobacteriales bacterium]